MTLGTAVTRVVDGVVPVTRLAVVVVGLGVEGVTVVDVTRAVSVVGADDAVTVGCDVVVGWGGAVMVFTIGSVPTITELGADATLVADATELGFGLAVTTVVGELVTADVFGRATLAVVVFGRGVLAAGRIACPTMRFAALLVCAVRAV